ncbi:uncharacterized protein LOC144114743 [Amblyomma americanum]
MDRHFNWVAWCLMDFLLAARFLGCLPINDDGRVEEGLELPVVNEALDGSEVLLSWEDSLPEGSRRDDLSQLAASSPIYSASAAVPVLQSTGNSSGDTSRASAGTSKSATAGARSSAGAGTSAKRREPQKSRHKR